MNVFAVIFWTLVVLAITKAATITGGLAFVLRHPRNHRILIKGVFK